MDNSVNNYKKASATLNDPSKVIMTTSLGMIEAKVADPLDVLRSLAITMIIVSKNIKMDFSMLELLLKQISKEVNSEIRNSKSKK